MIVMKKEVFVLSKVRFYDLMIVIMDTYGFLRKGGILVDNLGQYIREKRERRGMTIEELSKKTLISPAVLKDIEAGKFDRYTGEEAYVKMYLKKISQVLDLDTEGVTQQYIALTREIELEKIKEEETKQDYNSEMVEKGKNFTFKVPQLTRKPSVYEDQSHLTIIRTAIILVIVCLIIAVCWYGFYKTRDHTSDPNFTPQNSSSIEGEVTPEEETNNPDNTTPSDPTQQGVDAGVTFTRVDVLNFEFTLPENTEEFTFKVEFMTKSWAKMLVNGSTYDQFDSKIYHNNDTTEPDTVELTFKVQDFQKLRLRNGCSLGHRYYINGQQIPLTDEDSFERPSNLELVLKQ